ncbi:MAG: prepilin-type N-terminal cleavage/methylation domain-containing protein [Lachnospiraceae bacterium]|nr:prepilin-type N-terminal cleavage/methylation domain-containing protein [Lachnospiraceae bacterium]
MYKKKRKKLNNSGFSIIEVMVAMTIMVIVSVPLLNSISNAAKVNRRAKERQRATLIAQNVVEGLKSYDLEYIRRQFNDPTVSFQVLQGYDMQNYKELQSSTDGDGNPVLLELPTDGTKKETMYGIYGVEDGANKYDVLIKLNASSFGSGSRDPKGVINIASTDTSVIDSTGLTYPEELAGALQKSYSDKAVEELVKAYSNIYSESQIRANMSLKVTVTVKPTAGTVFEVSGEADYVVNGFSLGASESKNYSFKSLGLKKFASSNNIYVLFTPVSDADEIMLDYRLDDPGVKTNLVIVTPTTYSGGFDLNYTADTISNFKDRINFYTSADSSVFHNKGMYFDTTSYGGAVDDTDASIAPNDNNIYSFDISVEVFPYAATLGDKFKNDVVTTMEASKFE